MRGDHPEKEARGESTREMGLMPLHTGWNR